MGRQPLHPNRECSNCTYYMGTRNIRKGLVEFSNCPHKEHRITSHQLCEKYFYYRTHLLEKDREAARKLMKNKKDTIMKFRIANDWTCFNGIINIDLLAIHWEKKNCFWISILGISFIWEHLKQKERNKW